MGFYGVVQKLCMKTLHQDVAGKKKVLQGSRGILGVSATRNIV